MFFKKQKIKGKWYPRSFTIGKYDTNDVAKRLSEMCTVTKADTVAVLTALGEVLGSMLETGSSVKLDGLGTFYLTGKCLGQGVDTPGEVSSKQFGKVSVRFIPEYQRMGNNRVAHRTIVPNHVEWIEMDGKIK